MSSESVRKKARGGACLQVVGEIQRQAQRSAVRVRPGELYCTGDLLPAPEDWSSGDRQGDEVAAPPLDQRGSQTTPIPSRNF